MSEPTRILWIDATAGAAGDMILGALVDLGVPLGRVRDALRGLPLSGWTLSTRRVQRAGRLPLWYWGPTREPSCP